MQVGLECIVLFAKLKVPVSLKLAGIRLKSRRCVEHLS
jgi:hypothetical protein